MSAKRWFIWPLVLGLTLALTAGCTTARKPATPARPAPAPTAPGPTVGTQPLPTTPAEANRLAQKLAAEAHRVAGVKSATVILTGNTAIVGLDLKPGVKSADIGTIKTEVARRVKAADKRIRSVQVTTDPKMIARIQNVARGIAQGKPVSSFKTQVNEILKSITPTTR